MSANESTQSEPTDTPAQPVDWGARPLAELVAHIVDDFHEPHRRAFPGLIEAAKEVQSLHRGHRACPHGLAPFLEQLSTQLDLHMDREEKVLFPAMLAGESGQRVSLPVMTMMREHRHHDDQLTTLRRLAHDFVTPDATCDTWRDLYAALAEFDAALTEHFALENDVLFPRALAG